MAPLQKTASRPSTRSSPWHEEGYTQQYGRSSPHLAAEAAAAAAHQESGTMTSPELSRSTTPTHPRKQNSQPEGGVAGNTQAVPPLLPPYRRPSYAPAVPSPLNPASPTTSLKSRDSNTGSSEEIPSNLAESTTLSRSRSSNAVGIPAPLDRPSIPPPRRGGRKLLEVGDVRHQRPSPASRPQTPLALSDLGRDYSRYPFHEHGISHSASSSPPPHHRRGALVAGIGAVRTPLPVSSGNRDPFSDSSTCLASDEDPEKIFSPFLDDRIGGPSTAEYGYSFPMYLDEKEPDDDMHMPHPDDDKNLKPKLGEYFARGQIFSLVSMAFMILGLLALFVVLPVLSYTGVAIYGYHSETSLKDMGRSGDPEAWAFVNTVKYPLLSNIRTGLIDPMTPRSAMTRRGIDGDDLQLAFSDEFNGQNRTFYPGDDPFWTAPDLWYGSTQDLDWYDPDAATTFDGTLVLQLDRFPNHGLQFRSGMLNSWNQICFKGGALEVSISLAGPAGTPGLWPGAWTMGNLGRPGYKASTEGVWPYTYNSCDAGITPNQSSTDGLSELPGQKLPSCVCPGADHPTPGTGRGAPEIDVIEASVDPNNRIGIVTQSYQVAPFDIWYHPNYDFVEIPNYNTTQMNGYCGGPFQQAISSTTLLNKAWYDGRQYQKYAFEYTPGTGRHGQIGWFVGEDMSYMMTGNAIGPNGNIDSRVISQEPMSIILNLGFSTAWTEIDYANLKFPTTMHVDYVRWYQKPEEFSVTCDPEGYETTEYIKNHPKAYQNYNLTSWDETGYGWPKHKLNSEC